MTGPLIPIPRDKLPDMIGKGIHLAWAKPGCIWVLDRIEGDMLFVRTPTTNRRTTSDARHALYTRKHEPK